MRDLLLTLVVVVGLLYALRRPAVGAYLWAWLGLMNPHKAAFGFAQSFPFAQATAIVTLISMLPGGRRRPLPINAITLLLIALLGWMTLTTFFALSHPSDAWERLVFVLKIQVMLLVTLMVVRTKEEVDRLIWVVVLSIGFFGVKGGLFTLITGGGHRVWGPPGGMLEGNNELGVALTMVLPVLYYLQQVHTSRWVRRGLIASMVLIAFSILGTQSRGALLAMTSMALFLGLKSRYPVRVTLLSLTLLAAVVIFMPDSWSNRMDTISEYRSDGSAMSRLYTWTTLWNAAVDRPLIGAGFRADNPVVFQRYAPRDSAYLEMSGLTVDQVIYVAHSIYFQMLGEHGFVGLALFLGLGIATWRTAGRLSRQAMADPRWSAWVPTLMSMLQVSIIGYAVGGAFLSLAYLDLAYYFCAFVVLVDALMREAGRQQAPTVRSSASFRSPHDRGTSGPSHDHP